MSISFFASDASSKGLSFPVQGPRAAYVGNMQDAKNLLPVAITDLGLGLPALDTGGRDDGIRQDLFHMLHRIFKKISTDPSFHSVAGRMQAVLKLSARS